MHKRFIESAVEPLITKGVQVPYTRDQETAMRDAFIVRYRNGPERVVALFDVSGGDLADTGMGREFLWIADGLFGPQVASMNLAGVLPWIHWRGLLILGLLAAGNLSCMACPFLVPRTIARRWLPARLRWPRKKRASMRVSKTL